MLRAAAFLLCITFASAASAQADAPNGLLLIAKPGMADPRFRDTVVLVTQTKDFQTVGVILNRPTAMKLGDLWSGAPPDGYSGAVFFGGPVMDRVAVALFKSQDPPAGPA